MSATGDGGWTGHEDCDEDSCTVGWTVERHQIEAHRLLDSSPAMADMDDWNAARMENLAVAQVHATLAVLLTLRASS